MISKKLKKIVLIIYNRIRLNHKKKVREKLLIEIKIMRTKRNIVVKKRTINIERKKIMIGVINGIEGRIKKVIDLIEIGIGIGIEIEIIKAGNIEVDLDLRINIEIKKLNPKEIVLIGHQEKTLILNCVVKFWAVRSTVLKYFLASFQREAATLLIESEATDRRKRERSAIPALDSALKALHRRVFALCAK